MAFYSSVMDLVTFEQQTVTRFLTKISKLTSKVKMLVCLFSNRMLTIYFLRARTGDKMQIYYWEMETAWLKYLGMMLKIRT